MTTGPSNTQYQLFPEWEHDRFLELKESIREIGVLVPVEMDTEGNLLDGYHRVRAWEELRSEGVMVPDYPVAVRKFDSEIEKRTHIRRLNSARRDLTHDQRIEQVKRQWEDTPNASSREVAGICGVSKDTALRYRPEHATVHGETVARVVSRDGKARPAITPTVDELEGRRNKVQQLAEQGVRRRTIAETVGVSVRTIQNDLRQRQSQAAIIAVNKREAAQAQRLFATGAPLAGMHTMSSARREAEHRRRDESRQHAEARGQAVVLPEYVDVIIGDFREFIQQYPEDSVDLIFTDPPYDSESVGLYGDLARMGARVLKPGGSLIAYVGGYAYPDAMRLMCEHLTWWWPITIRYKGSTRRLPGRFIYVDTKPLLWFVKGSARLTKGLVSDLFETVAQTDKTLHDWAQGYAEAEYYIRHLCTPGCTVLDPMCGSGTTLLAAMRNGFRAIGIEIDEQRAAVARGRIAEAIERDAKAAQPGENGDE